MGWRCRFLSFQSNNSLLAKVKRSPFLFKGLLKKLLLAQRNAWNKGVWHRDKIWDDLFGKEMTLPDLLCVHSSPRHRKFPLGHQLPRNAIQALSWSLLGRAKPASQEPGLRLWQPLKGVIKLDVAGGHLLLWAKWRSSGREETVSFCLVLSMHNELCHFEITEQTVENDQKFWCTQFSPWEGKLSYFPNAWGKQIQWVVATHGPKAGVQGVVLLVGLQCTIYKNSQSPKLPYGREIWLSQNKIVVSIFISWGPCKASIQGDGFRLNERMPRDSG